MFSEQALETSEKAQLLGKLALALGLLLWITVVAIGAWGLLSYANAPGSAGHPSAHWPERIGLARSDQQPTLVMLAHPRCPCTRASIAELARIVARRSEPFDAHIVFYHPQGATAVWDRTSLWTAAERIPGVQLHRDSGGALTRAFGASTSGQVLLYDAQGDLVFHGGVTSSRGHQGDNVGSSVLLALLGGEQTRLTETPIYGCSILGTDCPSCCDNDAGCTR